MASLNLSTSDTKLFFYKPTYTKYSNRNSLLSEFVKLFGAEEISFTERNGIIMNTVEPLCDARLIDIEYLGKEYVSNSLTNNDIILFLAKNDGNRINTRNFLSALSLVFRNNDTVEIDVLVSLIVYKYGGSNLLTYLLNAMRESGIRLCVLKSLNTSFTFYQRYGFTYLGRKTKKNTNSNTKELYFGFDTFTDKTPAIKRIIENPTAINHIRRKVPFHIAQPVNVNVLEQFIVNQNMNNNVNLRSIPVNIMTKRKQGTRNNKNNPRWYIKKNKKNNKSKNN